MQYQKDESVRGDWLRAGELTDGIQIKIVAETKTNPNGKFGPEEVTQVKVKGFEGVKNARLNKTTLNAFVDAWGGESKSWIGKIVTARPDKQTISGRRVVVLYLVPEGYELTEDANGYVVIVKSGVKTKEPDGRDDKGYEEAQSEVEIPF